MSVSNSQIEPVRITCDASPAFERWMAQAGGSLAISTYQAGKVAMIGWDGQHVTLLMRQFDKPLGMAVDGNRLALATRNVIWLFANAPELAHDYNEQQPGRYDSLFLPRVTYHTSDLHTHDLAFSAGNLVLVNTRFSCLASLSPDYSFTSVWQPSFITELAPEDRCHLNGLAMVDGAPKYVTALGTTDRAGAWREKKATGGVVIDVDTHQVVLAGLAMPHSPRWHQGRLWVLNSGTGELLRVDLARGAGEVVTRLPGYLRGLSFVGPFALVGLCKIREKHIFGGLPIQQRDEPLRCGVAVVDTRSGQQVGFFEFTAGCEELFDVKFLAGLRRPMIVNLDRPTVYEAITDPSSSYWLRPSHELPVDGGTGAAASSSDPTSSTDQFNPGPGPSGTFVPGSGNQL